MHTYPAWKMWLVAVVLALATLLALPNVFGEAPALQLSRNDRSAFDEPGQAAVIGLLEAKGIPVDASYTEGDRLVLRFAKVEQQLAARDAIQEGAPRQYLIALSQVSRMPEWMRGLGLKPMSLGLDRDGLAGQDAGDGSLGLVRECRAVVAGQLQRRPLTEDVRQCQHQGRQQDDGDQPDFPGRVSVHFRAPFRLRRSSSCPWAGRWTLCGAGP